MATKPRADFTPRPRSTTSTTPGSVRGTFVDPTTHDESKLTIRLPKSLHREIKAQALADDVSVQEWVRHAITQKLDTNTAG